MKMGKSFLVHTVLCSTVFCFFSTQAQAVLTNVNATTTSALTPDSGNGAGGVGGYNFNAPNAVLTITSSYIVGQTAGVSIDNTAGNANNILLFAGNSTIQGSIAASNPILGIGLTGAGVVNFDGDVVNSTPIVFFADSTLSLASGVILNVNTGAQLDNQTGAANEGTLIFQGAGTVNGSIGQSNPLKLISVNTLGGNNTVTLASPLLDVNTINVVGAGGTTIKLDAPAAATVNANFTTNNNNVDTLDINNGGNTVLTGNIGSPTNIFNTVALSSATTTTINGNIYANDTEFTAAGVLQLGNNDIAFSPITTALPGGMGTVQYLGNSIILAPIGSAPAPLGLVNVAGAAGTNVDLESTIFTNAFTVNNGGTLTVVGTPTVTTNNFSITNGTLALTNASELGVTGPFTINGANTAITVDMNGNLDTTGEVVATGVATVGPPTKLTVFRPGFSPGVATLIPIVQGGPGSALAAIAVTNPDTFLTNFQTVVVGDTLNLEIVSVPLTEFATPPNQGVASTLDSIALGTPTTDGLSNLIEQLSLFEDVTSLNNALATLAPIVDGAIVYEGFMNQKRIFGDISDRINRVNFWRIHLNQVQPQSGYAAGDLHDRDYGGWIKVFRQHANQKRRQGIDGYRNDSWGAIMGLDTMLTDNSLLGWSLSWSSLDVHNNVSRSKTLANSYQGTVYSTIDFDCPFFTTLVLGAAYNNYIINRNILFGDFNAYPRSRFHGIQTGALAEAGYVYGTKMFHTIPFASLYYSNLNLRGYEEKRAGSINQKIQNQDYNMLQLGAGVRWVDDYVVNEKMLFQGEIHLQGFYDFIGDRMQATSQFVGAGPSFITPGFRPVKDSYNIGASASVYGANAVIFTANYDFDYKKNYTAHSGYLRVRYEW